MADQQPLQTEEEYRRELQRAGDSIPVCID